MRKSTTLVKPISVALLMETSRSFGRGVIRGVARYAGLHGPWIFHLTPGDLHPELPPAKLWEGDGVIGRIANAAMAAEIARRGLKVVCLGGDALSDQRYVGTRVEAYCSLAVEHLAERGFVRFGYFGGSGEWSPLRAQAFEKLVQARGLHAELFTPPIYHRRDHEALQKALVGWLQKLEKPVGVLAADDLAGRQVIDACAVAGLHVPEEVAVVGIDNDELICELAHPSLSSVALNGERIGFESARILHRMLRGEPPPTWVEVEPLGVVARESTDLLAIDDPDVVEALGYIRNNACAGLTVADVVARVSVSRSTLEQRFRQLLGRTPQVEIRRVQMQKAKFLLVESDLKLAAVAQKSGFHSVQYLHAAFQKEFGRTPLDYRRSNRSAGRK